ncbi:hypothetical protein V8G54_001282 [Vigna mungo]|uniref:Uncharacterized protein n=1 Tax=Vigna mungo TaxID=3915 RepID=A0AAQ3P700_VIGMU
MVHWFMRLLLRLSFLYQLIFPLPLSLTISNRLRYLHFMIFSLLSAGCLTLWCPCVSFGRIAEILDKGKTCKCVIELINYDPLYFLNFCFCAMIFVIAACCLYGSLFYLLAGFTQLGGCIYAWLYRAKLREVYGIKGHHCIDCLVSFLCLHLSICQEYRELKVRGFDISAGN